MHDAAPFRPPDMTLRARNVKITRSLLGRRGPDALFFRLRSRHLCAMAKPTTNAPEFTVGELAGALKRTIEESFGFVRLRGEISNFRGRIPPAMPISASRTTARIEGVIWKGAGRMRVKPEEGLDVIVSGKLTTFAS